MPTRALRRHRAARKKRAVQHFWRAATGHPPDPRYLGKLAHTPACCSCPTCRPNQKPYREPTRQERRQRDREREE